MLTYEALGLCGEGKAGESIDRNDFTYGGKRQLFNIAFIYGEVKYLQLQFGVLLYILAGIEKLQKNCKIWTGLVRGTIFMQFVRDNIR